MGQGHSTTLPPGSTAIEAAELSDLDFEKPLGGARFLRTVRARHQQGIVVAKVCVKSTSSVSFKHHARALKLERLALSDVPNVLTYARIRETNTVGLLVRQYIHNSLYDRISIRPFLETIEKKWIAFQLLCALRDCHSRGVYHGDVKSENVMVTSWGWVYLTDFSSTFKPVYLPEDNPADFTFYFDTSGRRTCYLAPERFFAAGQKPPGEHAVQWNMDIFSLGCVLAELFTETSTFTLSQLFKYRRGEYDPTAPLLSKIDDEHLRSLISSMMRVDPEERWHAQDYLDEYKEKAFPLYFYQHLHVLMQEVTDPSSGRRSATAGEINNGLADDRINRVYEDFEMLAVSLGFHDVQSPPKASDQDLVHGLFPLQIDLPNHRHPADASLAKTADNGTFILLNVVTSSIRSAARATSKVRACELLMAFAERLPDEAKLDRILPYVVPLLDDSEPMVLVAAIRTMTQALALVTVASPVNTLIFPQYIFPKLLGFVKSPGFRDHSIVRATYAACLASLAHTAYRFLDMISALKSDGTLPAAEKTVEDAADEGYQDSYDAIRVEVMIAFEGQTKVFLTDTDTAVRRAFLTAVPSLCVFFGEARASDVILSHLNTYLNDPDWQLKRAFFRTIVGVAVYIGGASVEEFILPLMLQALADPQELVVEQALRSLATMAELGLLQRSKTWELVDVISRFQLHPNTWIKEAASNFVSAATTYLSVADVRTLVAPLVQPYVKVPVSALTESELLDALKKPLPRSVLDLAIEWAKRVDRGIFWKSVRDSKQLAYRGSSNMPPTSSVADLGPKTLGRLPKNDEDEQWLGRLRNAGMRGEDEMKLLAFREYLWRAAQRQKKGEDAVNDTQYEQKVKLATLKIRPQTVIFDSGIETFERRMRDEGRSERTIAEALEEAAGVARSSAPKRLSIDGLSGTQSPADPTALAAPAALDIQPRRLSGLKKQASGSLSSSPSSGIGLLGERKDRHKSNAAGLLSGQDLRNKALPEVATDETVAAGRLGTPTLSSRRASPASQAAQRPNRPERSGSHRAVHNYAGNDPTVLRLLDAVYVDTFPADAAEFGPRIQYQRGPLKSSIAHQQNGLWSPECRMVAALSEHSARVNRIAVAPDHLFLLSGSDDGTVKIWDVDRLEKNVTHRSRQTYSLDVGVRVTGLCFVESTHTFVCSGSDGSIHVVKAEVAESPNNNRYSKFRNLRQWQIPTSSREVEYAVWMEHYQGDVSTLVIATNLGRMLAVDLRYMSIIYDLQNPPQHGMPTCFCLSRKQDWLLVSTTYGVLDLWDLRFQLRLRSWAFPSATPITRVQLHPARKSGRRNRVYISGGTAPGEISVWDIEKVICHEAYRFAQAEDQAPRPHHFELRNVDEERPDGPLGRIAGSVTSDPNTNDASVAGLASTTPMFVGIHHNQGDTEAVHTFALTGGPDGRVRFWDCDRLEGCRLVSGTSPDDRATYSYSQTILDMKIMNEHLEGAEQTDGGTAIESNRVAPNNSARRAASARAASKMSRYDTIRLSAQGVMGGHLDTVTDVALLERPFAMVISADRNGQIFIHQ